MAEHVTGILANCVDCGYDLRGQQDEPRCPECGRLNIPEAYREEVQELVDSGRWFFSSPFSLFAKRPPGWFWSLDRPGDVKRSFKRAATYVMSTIVIVTVSLTLADSVGVNVVKTSVIPESAETVTVFVLRWRVGVCGISSANSIENDGVPRNTAPVAGNSASFDFSPTFSRELAELIAAIVASLVGSWVCPAYVGLWTQVRKGLPGFARASATVLSACNYQAHRLVYAAALIGLLAIVDGVIRASVGAELFTATRAGDAYAVVTYCLVVFAVPIYAALGWAGVLRSDFTRQIVRSRWHAARIIWMYAILFSFALMMGAAVFVAAMAPG